MAYTKEELAKWLRAELIDIANDVANVRKSDMPEFNQGIDIICAYDTKVERILEKLAILEMYEALEHLVAWAKMFASADPATLKGIEVLAKAKSSI